MTTHTLTYARTHTSTYVSDNIRNILRDIVREGGLDPANLMDSWSGNVGNAAKFWLETGDLTQVTIEFYMPGSREAVARWDFPIQYDGSGVDDDMWVSKQHIIRTIAKAKKPPTGALYDVILVTKQGRPDAPGMVSCEFRSTNGLVARDAGTAIATPDIMASTRYWRAA